MALALSFRFFDLPLAHPFQISRYTVTVQKTVVVRISEDGISGYGEATVNPYYHSTVERLTQSLDRVADVVAKHPVTTPEIFWATLAPLLEQDYFALCAIDMAYWDFYARRHNRTVRSYFSAGEMPPITSYTIAIDRIENMQARIRERPWPLYKIKLGKGDDLEIVRQLRKVTDAVFRVDANAAWSSAQTIGYAQAFRELNVEFIEQPLPAESAAEMPLVKRASALPLIADESCQRAADVPACASQFHGINIKLMKCGGITPALRMIAQARELGLQVMAGCMTESSVGISGLMQLAPLLDYLDADGALLLASDIASGVNFENGFAQYPDRPGTGVELYTF